MPVVCFQHDIDCRVNDNVSQVIYQENNEKKVMVKLAGGIGSRCGGEKNQCNQGKPGQQTCPSEQQLFILNPFSKFIKKNQEDKNKHTGLKQESKLIACAQQTFQKNVFIQGKYTEDNTFNNLVHKMYPECFLFRIIKVFQQFLKTT